MTVTTEISLVVYDGMTVVI